MTRWRWSRFRVGRSADGGRHERAGVRRCRKHRRHREPRQQPRPRTPSDTSWRWRREAEFHEEQRNREASGCSLFRQLGGYRAESIEELLDVAKGSIIGTLPTNDQVAIVAVLGGVGVLMADDTNRRGSADATYADAFERLDNNPVPVRAPRHDRAQTPTVPICSAPYRWLPSSAYNWTSAIPEGAGKVHPEAHRRQDRTIVRRRWNADGYKSLAGPSHVVFFRRIKYPRKASNNNNIRPCLERSCRISLRTWSDASQGVRYGLPSHLAEQVLPGRAGCNFGAGSQIRHIADLRMKPRDRRCVATRELNLPDETWGQRPCGTGPCRSIPLFREPRSKRWSGRPPTHGVTMRQ